MLFHHKTTINILDFFKTGKFDYVQIGQTKNHVISHFPEPDGFSESFMRNKKKGDIWRYGNIELHFNEHNVLWMIFSDSLNDLHAGQHIILYKWILENPKSLHVLKVMELLNQENIDFKRKLQSEQVELTLQTSNIRLFFTKTEQSNIDYNYYILDAFSLQ